jgi:hypothetical protein
LPAQTEIPGDATFSPWPSYRGHGETRTVANAKQENKGGAEIMAGNIGCFHVKVKTYPQLKKP